MPSTAATTRVQERMLLCLLLRENYRQSVEQRRCRATIFYAISIKSARARCQGERYQRWSKLCFFNNIIKKMDEIIVK